MDTETLQADTVPQTPAPAVIKNENDTASEEREEDRVFLEYM